MVGLHFGRGRGLKTPGFPILQVSIFTFGPKKIKDRNVGKIVVRGKGWDASVGGWWFNLKLVDVLADRFNEKARR